MPRAFSFAAIRLAGEELLRFERPEPRRAANSAGIAVLGDENRSVGFFSEDIFFQPVREHRGTAAGPGKHRRQEQSHRGREY